MEGCLACIDFFRAIFTGMIASSELAPIVQLIPLDHHVHVCDALSLPNPEAVPPSMLPTHLEAGLKTWQAMSAANRREKLAKAFLQSECYEAALKLNAKCTHVLQNKGVGR